jgi:hypothetical protein
LSELTLRVRYSFTCPKCLAFYDLVKVEAGPASKTTKTPHEVDVSWSKDGDNITVRFADKTFTHETIHDDDDPTLEFVGDHEEPVTVRLTDDERLRLERTDLDRLNGY